MFIESRQNQRVKRWKKLHKKKYRDQEQSFLVEGWHLIEEVLNSDWTPQELIVLEGIEYPTIWERYPIYTVTQAVFDEVSQTESHQGVLAVVSQNESDHKPTYHKLLLIDSVQDPGNLGTIIRSAVAFNIDAVVVGQDSVDLYNDKVVRSTQGALFHLPIIRDELSRWLDYCHNHNIKVYGTALDEQALSLSQVQPSEKYAVIVGNEGSGVSETLLNSADETVYIPIATKSESLNVGVATSIVLYHFSQAT
ncbi:RNA methyltransferase [Alkalibacillus silvisoli]|uniref:RNA methyltransferase n=1 Tax=Alkalibacillus silvisoli TaxID=392823 RepID=A0ABN0ZRB8_9BACI